MQNPPDQVVAQFRHQDVRLLEPPHGQGQGTNMIMMAVRHRNGIQIHVLNRVEKRQRGSPLPFWMHPGVYEQLEPVYFHIPTARAYGRVWVEVDDLHVDSARATPQSAPEQLLTPSEKNFKKQLNFCPIYASYIYKP